MKVIAVCCALALLGTASAFAAAPKKANQVKAAGQKELPYALVPLDTSLDSLPERYPGHSCRGFAKAIAGFKPQKSEFETTAAYKERINAAGRTPMVGATSLADVVGFVQAGDIYSGVDETYDADDAVLKFKARWDGQNQSVGSQLLRSVELDQKIKSNRSYVGSNAYGKKVEVDSSNWDTCAVAFSNLTYYSLLSSGRKNIDESIEMSPDEARAAKGNLALMFVGNLSEPFLSEFHDYSKPTIDRPIEIVRTGDLIVMKLNQIWIFNRQTGKVYKKIDI